MAVATGTTCRPILMGVEVVVGGRDAGVVAALIVGGNVQHYAEL